MKTVKTILVAGVIVAMGCTLASVVILRRQAVRDSLAQRENAQREEDLDRAGNHTTPAEPVVAQTGDAAPAEEAPPTPALPEKAAPVVAPAKKPAKASAQSNPAPLSAKAPLRDPLARDALYLVGVDPEAEQYWALAINDPLLPPHERQDLIEDLNEEGFPDPKNLTVDDLPLILSRIALIEQHAADSMDEVNAAAFMEAYKDLWNMYARVTRR
jgi:hypothetical protein